MSEFRETIAFHAHGKKHGEFEDQLGDAISMCEEAGYQVSGIEHSVSVSYGESYDIGEYSAVVWCQRAISDQES